MKTGNPFYCDPEHPHFNHRAFHHDYKRPARYLITNIKNPGFPDFSFIPASDVTLRNPVVKLSALGIIIEQAISDWRLRYPLVLLPEIVIMPNHIHICADVTTYLKRGLEQAVAELKGRISSIYHFSLPEEGRPMEIQPVFAKGFNDRIAYTAEQWENQQRYVRDNPRRFIMKRMYPDYLRKHWQLAIGDRVYDLLGNIFLLRQPTLFRVKFSSKSTSVENERAMKEWKDRLRNGEVPISPFIHRKEKELRDFAIEEGFAYIKVCTNGIADRAAAQGREFDLMAEGRLLFVAPAVFLTRPGELRYSYASRLNDLAAEIAELCNSGIGARIQPI